MVAGLEFARGQPRDALAFVDVVRLVGVGLYRPLAQRLLEARDLNKVVRAKAEVSPEEPLQMAAAKLGGLGVFFDRSNPIYRA